MPLDDATVRTIADAYTAAWNSGSADAVSMFFAEDGRIEINRGSPWEGRSGVAQMAAGFFADIPDLALVCDGVRGAGNHVAYLWTLHRHPCLERTCASCLGLGGVGPRRRPHGPSVTRLVRR